MTLCILYMKADCKGCPKMLKIVDTTDFSQTCIKTRIKNVTRKKRETLLDQRFSLFCTCPNFRLGTLLNLFMYTL